MDCKLEKTRKERNETSNEKIGEGDGCTAQVESRTKEKKRVKYVEKNIPYGHVKCTRVGQSINDGN